MVRCVQQVRDRYECRDKEQRCGYVAKFHYRFLHQAIGQECIDLARLRLAADKWRRKRCASCRVHSAAADTRARLSCSTTTSRRLRYLGQPANGPIMLLSSAQKAAPVQS